MKEHSGNKYSWYPISFHKNVEDATIARIKIGKNVELRFDTIKSKPVVIRSKTIEREPRAKINKVKELRRLFDRQMNLAETINFVKENKNLIINIVNK